MYPIRKVATVVLYRKDQDGKKRILMQHRADDAKRLPGYWSSFGGGLEGDETPLEAAIREMCDETEYRLRDPQLLYEEEYDSPEQELHLVNHTFVEEYDGVQPIVLHEGQGYGWFTINEALQLKITETRKKALAKIAAFLETV